jgi:hypothetical protein
METISIDNVQINGIVRKVNFTKISEDLFEVTSDSQPKLVIKPYKGIFPVKPNQFCVMHQHGIVFASTPAEAFDKATKRYWDGKQLVFSIQ